MNWYIWFGSLFFLCFYKLVDGVRDYYVGVFNKNDFLVAQDVLYQEKLHYRTVTAKYVRHFTCPISYYRILDRLGVGIGPRIEKINGGLQKNFLALRFTSVFNQPINVNIYIGCANRKEGSNEPIYTRTPWTRGTKHDETATKEPNGKDQPNGDKNSETKEKDKKEETNQKDTTEKQGEADKKDATEKKEESDKQATTDTQGEPDDKKDTTESEAEAESTTAEATTEV